LLPRVRELRDAILQEGYRSSTSSEDFAAKEKAVAQRRREMTQVLKELASRQAEAACGAIREVLLEGRAGLTAEQAALVMELLRKVPDRSGELAEETAGALGGTRVAEELLRQSRQAAEASLEQALRAEIVGSPAPDRRALWLSEFRARLRSPTHAANLVWGIAGLLIGAVLGVLGTLLVQWASR
jgi:hypothetical protein